MSRKNKANWEILEDFIYEQFHIFTLKRSKRVNPRTGEPFSFFLMEGLDWVNIIPITPQNNVVLVRQYRHGSEDFTLETPGGTVEPGEDPKATALRELTEETVHVATNIEFLGTLHPNPAMQKMQIHYYISRGVTQSSTQALDPGEDIQVIERPLAEISEMIKHGEISSALVVAAFGLLQLKDGG